MEDIVCYKMIAVENEGIWLKHQDAEIYVNFDECAKNYACENSLAQNRCVATRDVTNRVFIFYTLPKTKVIFKKSFLHGLFGRKSAVNRFHDLYKTIIELGYSSCDIS